MMRSKEFGTELALLLNRFSAENESNTPDFILAAFMMSALNAFDNTVNTRSAWSSKPAQDEQGVEEWFAGLRTREGDLFIWHYCDKCNKALGLGEDMDTWKQKHFKGLCIAAPSVELTEDAILERQMVANDMMDLAEKNCSSLQKARGVEREHCSPVLQMTCGYCHEVMTDTFGEHALGRCVVTPDTANDHTPELSLLLIDLGDCIVLRVEHNDKERWLKLGTMGNTLVGLGGSTVKHIGCKTHHFIFEPFDKVRAAIDAMDEKPPIPRLELRQDRDGRFIEIMRNGPYGRFSEAAYRVLCEIAGVTLPVYEPKRGKWLNISENFLPVSDIRGATDLPVAIWRYTLEAQ